MNNDNIISFPFTRRTVDRDIVTNIREQIARTAKVENENAISECCEIINVFREIISENTSDDDEEYYGKIIGSCYPRYYKIEIKIPCGLLTIDGDFVKRIKDSLNNCGETELVAKTTGELSISFFINL